MVAVGSFYKFGQAKNTVKKSDILDITTNKLPGFSVQSSLYEYQCMTITLHQLVNVTYCDNTLLVYLCTVCASLWELITLVST